MKFNSRHSVLTAHLLNSPHHTQPGHTPTGALFPELINLEILQLLKSFLPLFDKILEEQQLNNIGKFIVFYTMFKVCYLICKVFDFI